MLIKLKKYLDHKGINWFQVRAYLPHSLTLVWEHKFKFCLTYETVN